MIRIVLFDLGNVILPFDVMRLAGRLTAFSRLSTSEIVDRLWSHEIAEEFETGRLAPQDYFDLLTNECGFKDLNFDDFIPIFNEIFDEEPGAFALLERLKIRYKLGLISNTNPIHSSHLEKSYPQLAHFEKRWWSSEAGVRKPDPAIYRMALQHFSAEPQETVFIDDMPVNVASARKLGMNALLYKGLTSLKKDLAGLGVEF